MRRSHRRPDLDGSHRRPDPDGAAALRPLPRPDAGAVGAVLAAVGALTAGAVDVTAGRA